LVDENMIKNDKDLIFFLIDSKRVEFLEKDINKKRVIVVKKKKKNKKR